MVGLADHPSLSVAARTRNAGHDPDCDLLRVQDRSLLDMDLQERRHVVRPEPCVAGTDPVGIEAAAAHMRLQRAAGIPPGSCQRLGRERAQCRAAARKADREPGAGFFGAGDEQRQVAGRNTLRMAQPRQAGEPGEHAHRTVVVAALHHRIQVAADDQAPGRAVAARQRQGKVAGMIDMLLQSEPASGIRDAVVRALLARTVRIARDPVAVDAVVVQGPEQRVRECEVRRRVAAGLAHPAIAHPRMPGRSSPWARAQASAES